MYINTNMYTHTHIHIPLWVLLPGHKAVVKLVVDLSLVEGVRVAVCGYRCEVGCEGVVKL